MAIQTMTLLAQEKLVALSFDDGPNTTTTVHMLDVLKKHGVRHLSSSLATISPKRVP